MTLYFAYGSNMDAAQMKERCPDSLLVGTAVLKDYALEFNIFSLKRQCGCADIVPRTGHEIWGLVYTMTDHDLEKLDIAEGRRHQKYDRTQVVVRMTDGTERSCMTYVVVHKTPRQTPSRAYLDLMTHAAQVNGFPEPYIALLTNISTTAPN